jgi:2-phospho-L-lactate guanylyltransferase
MPRDPGLHTAGVVMPLRSFTLGKARLASTLNRDDRTELVREMATRVADAAGDRPLAVVSSAADVIEWARGRGLACLPDPGSLDRAAAAGHQHFRAAGLARVVVVHADLPLATTLDHVAGDGDERVAVIVPCHRGDGTPVLAFPADVTFPFAYGPGSFARHCATARELGLRVRVVRDPALSFDVDVPEDLQRLPSHVRAT